VVSLNLGCDDGVETMRFGKPERTGNEIDLKIDDDQSVLHTIMYNQIIFYRGFDYISFFALFWLFHCSFWQ
jgi:hypothetical protein